MKRPTDLEIIVLGRGLDVYTSKPNSEAHIKRIAKAHQDFRIGLERGWKRDGAIRYALSIAAEGVGHRYRNEKYKEALEASSLSGITSISQLIDWTNRSTRRKRDITPTEVCNRPSLMLLWQKTKKIILGYDQSVSREYNSI